MPAPALRTALFCVVLAASPFAAAQDTSKPILLVASPSLEGAFSRTTLVAIPVQGKHLGFILNRATDLKLSTLFPDHAPSARVAAPLYIGGPEMNEALFAVVPRDPGDKALLLFGGLYVTGKAESIDRIIEQTPNDARFFSGFVGWQPGELQGEIERGMWYVAEPEAGLVFSADPNGMWEALVTRLDGQPGVKQPVRGVRLPLLEARRLP